MEVRKWLWTRWHGPAPWWQMLLLGAVVGALVVGGLTVVVDSARGETARPTAGRICQPDPPPDLVCSPAQFIAYFKAGAYSRAQRRLPYSIQFARMFLHKMEQYQASHPKYQPCPGSPDLGCTWQSFKAHDSCAVSSLPDTFDADSCRASHGLKGLLSSPYWRKRGELYNKWVARIIVCGGTAVAAIALKGSPQVAIGAGASGCLANRLVP